MNGTRRSQDALDPIAPEECRDELSRKGRDFDEDKSKKMRESWREKGIY